MLTNAEKDGYCDACGGGIAQGTPATCQLGPPGAVSRTTHRVSPGAAAGPRPAPAGQAAWETVDLVELSGWPPDDPIPLVLTAEARRALAWR